MREQANLAIAMADVILFLTDIKQGVTAADREISIMLKKSGKPIVLVCNKADNFQKDKEEAYEFYNLGMGDPYPISATNALGIGDVLDKIYESFPENIEENKDENIIKVAVIGKPNVGKSSLINKILGENRAIVSDIAGTTRDAIDTEFENENGKYVLIDTAGLRRKNKVSDNIEYYANQRTFDAVDSSEICLFLIDATVGVTEQDTKIAGYAHNQKKAIIIAVNKWDKVQKETNTMKNMEKEIRNKLSFALYAPIIFISVLKGQRITDLLNLIEIVNSNYHTRIKTGVLNTILQDAIMMTAPPQDKGKRLKIFYISQVQTAPPKFLLHVNDKELMHFSYQRYLENQIRQNYSLQGVPFTFEIRERKEK